MLSIMELGPYSIIYGEVFHLNFHVLLVEGYLSLEIIDDPTHIRDDLQTVNCPLSEWLYGLIDHLPNIVLVMEVKHRSIDVWGSST